MQNALFSIHSVQYNFISNLSCLPLLHHSLYNHAADIFLQSFKYCIQGMRERTHHLYLSLLPLSPVMTVKISQRKKYFFNSFVCSNFVVLILTEPAKLTLYKLLWFVCSLCIHLKLRNQSFNLGYPYRKQYARDLQHKAVVSQIK